MVDTSQEALQSEEAAKKRKDSPKKGGVKSNAEEKGVVKKLPVRKDNAQVKAQGQAKTPAAPKGQTVAKLQKFLRGAWAELKKVHWPNKRELITFTTVVLIAVVLVAILIFAVDSVLSKLLDLIIPK